MDPKAVRKGVLLARFAKSAPGNPALTSTSLTKSLPVLSPTNPPPASAPLTKPPPTQTPPADFIPAAELPRSAEASLAVPPSSPSAPDVAKAGEKRKRGGGTSSEPRLRRKQLASKPTKIQAAPVALDKGKQVAREVPTAEISPDQTAFSSPEAAGPDRATSSPSIDILSTPGAEAIDLGWVKEKFAEVSMRLQALEEAVIGSSPSAFTRQKVVEVAASVETLREHPPADPAPVQKTSVAVPPDPLARAHELLAAGFHSAFSVCQNGFNSALAELNLIRQDIIKARREEDRGDHERHIREMIANGSFVFTSGSHDFLVGFLGIRRTLLLEKEFIRQTPRE